MEHATRRWLERAVIGLGLCPFAAPVVRGSRLRLTVSDRDTPAGVLAHLHAELLHLAAVDADECETTLLIHPWALADFLEFNDFLGDCASLLARLGLEGELQIASFHPRYRFAGTQADDIENYTNRAPYPMLHLLREASIDRAIDSGIDTDGIYRHNIETLRALGLPGWRKLWEE